MRARGLVPNGADRRSLGKGSEGAVGANPDPDIDTCGNRGLHGFPAALCGENFEGYPVLLEDPGLLSERRRLIFPIRRCARGKLEQIVGAGTLRKQQCDRAS
jgi:hypothetical protein